jgi:hypothetical protein
MIFSVFLAEVLMALMLIMLINISPGGTIFQSVTTLLFSCLHLPFPCYLKNANRKMILKYWDLIFFCHDNLRTLNEIDIHAGEFC